MEDAEEVDEWELIAQMIKRAQQSGMLVEVIHAFWAETKRGEELAKACWNALYEWDCLD